MLIIGFMVVCTKVVVFGVMLCVFYVVVSVVCWDW